MTNPEEMRELAREYEKVVLRLAARKKKRGEMDALDLSDYKSLQDLTHILGGLVEGDNDVAVIPLASKAAALVVQWVEGCEGCGDSSQVEVSVVEYAKTVSK